MEVFKGTITRRLDSVIHDLEEEFSTLYCAKDIQNCLDRLEGAGNGSDRPSKLKSLFEMLDDCGIPYEKGKPNEYYEELVQSHMAEFPDSSEIENRLLVNLFEKYQDYPSPGGYMQSLVDKLGDSGDGWDNEPLRLRILKQFIKYGGYLRYETEDENGKKQAHGFGGQKAIQSYVRKKIGRKPSEEEVLKFLDDGIFDVLPTASGDQTKPDRTYGLLKATDDLACGKFRTQGGTKRYLYMFAMVYNMTYSLGNKDRDKNQGPAGGSDIIDYSSDVEIKLFQEYYTNNLIRFASDAYKNGNLSDYEVAPSGQGINYKNFAEMIYLYFIAQDMSPQEKFRRSREMIEAAEKEAREMNEEAGKTAPGQGQAPVKKDKGTKAYRGLWHKGSSASLYAEDILEKSEDEFMEFLLENYNCNTYLGTQTRKIKGQEQTYKPKYGEQELETEQRTACGVYEELVGKLVCEMAKLCGAPKDENYDYTLLPADKKKEERKTWLKEYNYGMWFAEGAALRDNEIRQQLCDKIRRLLPEEKKASVTEEKLDDFITLLLSLDYFLGERPGSAEKGKVTRTSMIVAFYYYYNARWENRLTDKGVPQKDRAREGKNFHDVFREFAGQVDPYLEKAYYQPLNGKNIFDLLAVFSSYAYINDFMIQ
ncbi:MAG: hypothetical protein LUE16_06495 [Lachnospiraceae bacterium]|nr:hypothetical protein [Lachnospiraceae bacterium]